MTLDYPHIQKTLDPITPISADLAWVGGAGLRGAGVRECQYGAPPIVTSGTRADAGH